MKKKEEKKIVYAEPRLISFQEEEIFKSYADKLSRSSSCISGSQVHYD